MTTSKDFEVFDSDSHVVEPREVWEKYLEPEYRVLGKHALWREEGRYDSYLKINGQVFRDTANPNIPRHAVWKPGMTWDSIGELDPDTRHPMSEGAWDPEARLRDMDAMGIDRAFLYPTWFAEGFHLVEDPDVVLRAGPGVQQLDGRLLPSGARSPVRRRDGASRQHGLRYRRVAPRLGESGVSAGLSFAPCSWKGAISPIPTTILSGENWKAWA